MTPEILNTLQGKARGQEDELLACLQRTTDAQIIGDTRTTCHCYHVKLDGNNRPLIADLMKSLKSTVIDYAIPRSQIDAVACPHFLYQIWLGADRWNAGKRGIPSVVVECGRWFSVAPRGWHSIAA